MAPGAQVDALKKENHRLRQKLGHNIIYDAAHALDVFHLGAAGPNQDHKSAAAGDSPSSNGSSSVRESQAEDSWLPPTLPGVEGLMSGWNFGGGGSNGSGLPQTLSWERLG